MASRSDIEEKIDSLQGSALQNNPCAVARRECLRAMSAATGRDTILYAGKSSSPHEMSGVVDEDLPGMMEALNGLKGERLDLILHSNGGDGYTAEQIGNYLREKYSHIRAIVPQKAMSAATMMACACDEIIMGKHSAIGPIDPQVPMPGWGGQHFRLVAIRSVLEEFETAKKEMAEDPRTSATWLSRIDYPGGFLTDARKAVERAQSQVYDWLKERMLKNDPDKAKDVSEWLAMGDHKEHGRPINIAMAQKAGLPVSALEDEQEFQDMVLSAFHAMAATFQREDTVKIIENQMGGGREFRARPFSAFQ